MQHFRSYLAGIFTAFLLLGLVGIASAKTGKVSQELEYRNIQVTLDGKVLDLRNAAGEKVEPFMFGGTNYLPVRALAEALGLDVSWDGFRATVVLTTPNPAVTDGYITEAAAKSIALNHAGLTESAVTFLHVELEKDRMWQYEVEFYNGQKEYDYKINAQTGVILSFDQEAERRPAASEQQNSGKTTSVSTAVLSEDAVKAIALSHAGRNENQVTGLRVKLGRDNGRLEYEVEFYVGRVEYSYDIDAVSGKIIDYDTDND